MIDWIKIETKEDWPTDYMPDIVFQKTSGDVVFGEFEPMMGLFHEDNGYSYNPCYVTHYALFNYPEE